MSRATIPRIVGLVLALGGPPLVAVISENLSDSATGLVTGLLAQSALIAICTAVVAKLLIWEGQPLSSIGLQPLRCASLAWGAALAGFFVFVFSPTAVWFLSHFELSGFGVGLRKLATFPSWYLVIAVVVGGTVEEVLYRGYAVEQLAAVTGSYWWGGLVSLLAFGAAHVPMWGWCASVTTLLSGGVATLFYIWRRDLDALIIAHVVTDFVGIVVTPILTRAT